MPSLRRTLSSPSVRASPYPSSLSATSSSSSSAQAQQQQRAQPSNNRRSSGSETYTRRVLADIEWWRVHVGQTDEDAETIDEQTSDTVQNSFLGPSVASSVSGVDVMVPLIEVPQTAQFAALAITPQTPPRRREASSSSLESSPASDVSPIEGMRLSFEYLDLDYDGETPLKASMDQPVLPLLTVQPRSLEELFLGGVDSYADFVVSPLSSHFPEIFN